MAKSSNTNSSARKNPKLVIKPTKIPTGNVGTKSGNGGKIIKK